MPCTCPAPAQHLPSTCGLREARVIGSRRWKSCLLQSQQKASGGSRGPRWRAARGLPRDEPVPQAHRTRSLGSILRLVQA